MKLIAHQGDTLDSLIFRHYGRTANLVELALELNPHLANQPILTIGQVVDMPEINQQPQKATKATMQLWD